MTNAPTSPPSTKSNVIWKAMFHLNSSAVRGKREAFMSLGQAFVRVVSIVTRVVSLTKLKFYLSFITP